MKEQEEIQHLIRQSLRQDTAAFARLVSSHQAMVYRLAFRMLCHEEEAKDVTQETFVKAWLSLGRYNPSYRFSTWIYRIACNLCLDRLRAQASFHRQLTEHHAYIASDEDIETTLANKELAQLILRFTSELTPKQRLVFVLRDVEERELSDVALITGLSPEKIKSNLYLARKNIREKINQLNANV